jgi:hypothetical protein
MGNLCPKKKHSDSKEKLNKSKHTEPDIEMSLDITNDMKKHENYTNYISTQDGTIME